MSDHHKRAQKTNTDTHLYQSSFKSHQPHDHCCFHGSFFQPDPVNKVLKENNPPHKEAVARRPVRNMGMPHLPLTR